MYAGGATLARRDNRERRLLKIATIITTFAVTSDVKKSLVYLELLALLQRLHSVEAI